MKILKNFFRFFVGVETIGGLLFHLLVLSYVPDLGPFIVTFLMGGEILLVAYAFIGGGISIYGDLDDVLVPYIITRFAWWLIWILTYISQVPTS